MGVAIGNRMNVLKFQSADEKRIWLDEIGKIRASPEPARKQSLQSLLISSYKSFKKDDEGKPQLPVFFKLEDIENNEVAYKVQAYNEGKP